MQIDTVVGGRRARRETAAQRAQDDLQRVQDARDRAVLVAQLAENLKDWEQDATEATKAIQAEGAAAGARTPQTRRELETRRVIAFGETKERAYVICVCGDARVWVALAYVLVLCTRPFVWEQARARYCLARCSARPPHSRRLPSWLRRCVGSGRWSVFWREPRKTCSSRF